MEAFDTHAHFEGTDAETRALLERATASGVSRVAAIGGSPPLNAGAAAAQRIAASAPSSLPTVYLALGRDRDQIGEAAKDIPPIDFSLADAVGEIGLDYHYSPETRKEQMALMADQLELARSLSLPVVVHTREADDDTLGLLREIPSRGVIHSFTGGVAFCKSLLDLGFFVSISGIVTFRAADNVRETALAIPDDRLLVETDTPFLAPVPKRGNPNEPAFVVYTIEALAKLRGVAAQALAETTTRNALAVFGAAPRAAAAAAGEAAR